MTPDQIIKSVAHDLGITQSAILGKREQQTVYDGRCIFAYLCLDTYQISRVSVLEAFPTVSMMRLVEWLHEARAMMDDPDFEALFQRAANTIKIASEPLAEQQRAA